MLETRSRQHRCCLDCSELLFPWMKRRKVMPLGNIQDQFFLGAVFGEIRRQLLPQKPRMGSNDAVFARVIARGPSEDADANLLLGRVFRSLPNRTFGYVKQEFPQSRRGFQVLT